MGLFGFLFNLLISIGLGYIQHQLAKRAARRAQRQAREQFEANAGLDVRPESGGQTIPLAYGATAVQGILAYARTRHTVEDAMVPDTWGTLEHGSSKHFAYLLAQYILCAAGGVTLRDIQIDGIPYDDDQMTKVVAHQIHQAAASDVATAFTDERTTADVFTDLAAVTGVYKYDIDDPIFGGIPRPVFFIEGRQIPRVQSQSALAASKTYSPNAVRVLLDFLLDSVWGPGLDVADIDLASFRRAQLIADRVMQGSASALWDQAYPAALNTLYGTAYSKWSDYFTAVGLTSQSDPGVPGWHGVSAPAVRRYEFHGTLFSTGEWADTVETNSGNRPGRDALQVPGGQIQAGAPGSAGQRRDDSPGHRRRAADASGSDLAGQ